MKTKFLICVWLASLTGGCGSGSFPAMSADEAILAARSCEPGAVVERLAEDMQVGLPGSDAKQTGELYDAFFQIMRKCGSVQDTDFIVNIEWGDPAFVTWLLDVPPLPPYRYSMRLSKSGGLCVSRKGMESALVNHPKWYCERGGWTDEI